MLHVSIDTLRHNLGDVLSHVTVLGEEVVLTRHGKPLARLCPLEGIPITSTAATAPERAETAVAGKSGGV